MSPDSERMTKLFDLWCDAALSCGQLRDNLTRFYAVLRGVLADPTITDDERRAAMEHDRQIRWSVESLVRALRSREALTAGQERERSAVTGSDPWPQ